MIESQWQSIKEALIDTKKTAIGYSVNTKKQPSMTYQILDHMTEETNEQRQQLI